MSRANRQPASSASTPSLQELRAARGTTPSLARRYRGWLIAGGVFIALVLFGFFGLPPIIKAQAVKQLSERLGREVAVERVRVNPLVLSVAIEGFAIAEADPAAGEFTGWNRLYVNLDSWPLLLGRVRFQAIELDGFRARVARDDAGVFNYADIVARLTKASDKAAAPTESAKPEGKLLAMAIARLAVNDARVSFSDAGLERPFATVAGPVSFTLSDFHTVGDPNAPYSFEVHTDAGERLAWRGSVSVDPVKSVGELVLENINIARFSPYYHTLVEGELKSAFVDFSGRYEVALGEGEPVLTLADGRFVLREVRFGAADSEVDAFALRRLEVSGLAANAVKRSADVARVSVEGVAVRAVRDAEGIDLVRLAMPRAAASGAASEPAPGAEADEAAPLPVVRLGEFSVSDVKVVVEDITQPRRAEHRIENVEFSLRDLDSSDLARALPLALAVTLPEGGRVALSGTVSAAPLAAELDVAVAGVRVDNASPYVEPFINLRLASGAVRVNGKATLRDGAAGFAGDFGVGGFRAVDGKAAEDFVRWEDFSISGIRATTEPLAFHADEIRFVKPVASLRVEQDGSLNIAKAASPVAESAAAETGTPTAEAGEKAAPLPAITVGVFALEDATFRYEDNSIAPAARTSLTNFHGKISGLSSEALGRADVHIEGKVDGVAPVLISGKMNPLGVPAFVDLVVDFRNIDLLPGAGPYVGKFVGRELSRGSLSVAVKAKLNDRKIDTDNLVVFDQFYLGERTNSPDATKLPVGLALALLRDVNGKISLPVPVKGSLDDPQFKIGRVVAQVFVNILTKAATSPFSLLGAAFGGGGDELGWQDFAAGSANMDEAGLKKLETVAKALGARPALKLEIAGGYDPVRDGAALRLDALEKQVRAAAWEERRRTDPATPPADEIVITEEERLAVLTRLYALNFPAVEGVIEAAVTEETPIQLTLPESEPTTSQRVVRRQVGRLTRYGETTSTLASRRAPAVLPVVEPAPVVEPVPTGAPAVEGVTPERMVLRLAAGIQVTDTDLRELGDARAQAVRTWLLETGAVPAERVFLGPLAPGGARVNLNLQ
jgi:hypothetical protein